MSSIAHDTQGVTDRKTHGASWAFPVTSATVNLSSKFSFGAGRCLASRGDSAGYPTDMIFVDSEAWCRARHALDLLPASVYRRRRSSIVLQIVVSLTA